MIAGMNAPTKTAPLINATELTGLLGSPGLVLLDCRFDLANPAFGQQVYGKSHIPGALFASMEDDLSARVSPGTGRHPLPDPASFAATLGRWGFTSASQVIAYDQGNGAAAARLWWMLRARGHSQVRVLNGGFAAWTAANGPVTAAIPVVVPTSVTAQPYAGVMDAAAVATGLANRQITLVDARAADRFAGRNETIDPVAGHIPGALNHPFAGNLDDSAHFLPAQQLRLRWASELQLAKDAPLVAMCGSGITACHNLLALELAGHTDARLYAGSWSHWITDPARPVATGE